MKRIFIYLLLMSCSVVIFSQGISTSVLVIGGGTGGTAAGIQSARLKVHTIIAEPTPWLGGMLTAAGVSATDGNHNLPSGLWEELRQQLYKHYGTQNLATGWVSNTLFEPHVGDSIFKNFCNAEKKYLTVLHGLILQKIIKKGNTVTGAVFTNAAGKAIIIKAAICIDATEQGDAIAMSGAGYDMGMEDAAYSGEPMAPGKNTIIQDLTWAAVLKDYGKNANKTIERPQGYDSSKFFKSCINQYNSDSSITPWTAQKMLNYGKIKNGKYMINWPASGNDYYLNLIKTAPAERADKYMAAKNHTLQFIYFIQKELGYKNLGLANDEYPTEDKLPFIPYNRESRRLKGLARLTNNELVNPFYKTQALYRTGISVGDYPVDHHHHKNETAPQIKFTHVNSYNIPLGALIPSQTDGLIAAEKNISVSNIANGTTRLQPVVLLTGQAAGALAAYCVQNKVQPRKASIRVVQQLLLDAKCFLMPYVDVLPADTVYWQAIQKAGATGILKGTGKSEGWANKTYFYPDSTISYDVFKSDINRFIPCLPVTDTAIMRPLQVKEAWDMLASLLHAIRLKRGIPHPWPPIIANEQVTAWKMAIPGPYPGDNAPIKRKHIAKLMDALSIHPFMVSVDFGGQVK
jgi:FAD dependent oxidoreductase